MRRVVGALVCVAAAAAATWACSVITGASEYSSRDCQGCLQTLCGSEVATCNSDRGCATTLACLQDHCPDTPGEPRCSADCKDATAEAATAATPASITSVRACGFKNCISCMSPPSAFPSGD